MTRPSLYGRAMLGLTLALAAAVAAAPVRADTPARVVTIGGAVTEIAYALGQGERLVGRDTTSSFPPAAEALPDVGYMRALSPEGVLSVAPDLIVSVEGAGPPEAVAVLEEAGIPFVTVPEGFDRAAIATKIRAVGTALGVAAEAEALAADVEARIAAAETAARAEGAGKRVLFILSTQGGRIMAAGRGTAADGILRMAGAENAMAGFQGYKQVTDEAVIAAAPDAILMMDRGGDHGLADDALFGMPAIATTPAAATRSVVRMDGLHLLGFGPRTASAVTELAAALSGTAGQ